MVAAAHRKEFSDLYEFALCGSAIGPQGGERQKSASCSLGAAVAAAAPAGFPLSRFFFRLLRSAAAARFRFLSKKILL